MTMREKQTDILVAELALLIGKTMTEWSQLRVHGTDYTVVEKSKIWRRAIESVTDSIDHADYVCEQMGIV